MKKTLLKTCGLSLLLLAGGLLSSGWAWAQQAATRQRSATANYPSSTMVGGATVSYDPETRKLIVVTDDDTAQQISQVISNVDRAAPQVLIKVVFLEVTYRKGLDIGVEGSYTRSFGSGNSLTGLVRQVFGRPATGNGGLYAISGNDFQATLHALAEAGKTEVLSRPSILARNNQQATITVGQQVPLVTNVRYDNFGNQISSVQYTSVGIILQVTPFITSDGMVEMIVTPEISDLSEEDIVVSRTADGEEVTQPIINLRSADTVVVTPDGQTVVIGGLMAKAKKETITKIPVLGDIPGLGALFRRKVQNDAKTELMIFLTPHIVKEPAELAGLTSREKASTELVPQSSFSEQELNRFLESLPASKEEAPKSKRK
jgi:general secretion pathway protein D